MLSHLKKSQKSYSEGSLTYEFFPPPKSNGIKRLRPSPSIVGDRFIPVRGVETEISMIESSLLPRTPYDTPYKRAVLAALNIPDRLLSFSSQKPVATSRSGLVPIKQEKNTILLTQPRVLDAPDVLQDDSSHVLAWSNTTQVHVGLGDGVEGSLIYSKNWLDTTDTYSCTMDVPSVVYSVVALNDNQVASGWADGMVRIHHFGLASENIGYESTIPVALSTTLHAMVATSPFTLMCGNSRSELSLLDIRSSQPVVAGVNASHNPEHLNKIIGLAYDGEYYVANGSEDSSVKIWDIRRLGPHAVMTNTAHSAGVKALAFCPDSKHYLMSGGGAGCHSLSLYNITTNQVENRADTGSPVTGLHWFKNDPKYIVTSHGSGDCAVRLWNVSTSERSCLVKTSFEISNDLFDGVLSLAGSPTTNDFAAVTKKETLRFFKPEGLNMPATSKKRRLDDPTLSCAPTIR